VHPVPGRHAAADPRADCPPLSAARWLARRRRKKLIKSFKVKNWVEAVDFVNRISPVAEAENHHPDLYVRWGEVRAYLWTHKIDGLTESDFYMAAKIDRAFVAA